MAITRISQSSVKEGLEKYNSFYAGLLGAFIGNFESIATVTVGSGGASSVDFTNIPGSYQHLQVRVVCRSSRASGLDNTIIRLGNGSVDSGSNYSHHYLYGWDSGAGAGGAASQTLIYAAQTTAANVTSSIFGSFIVDVLDYANTSKNKTVRVFGGEDINTAGGEVWMSSGAWLSTSAVTHLSILPNIGPNFAQYSTAALYGIKAP